MTTLRFTPFSDNIIFFDTEFSSLDPYKGEILSVGMVKLDGDEFYIELEHGKEMSDWVKENLLHILTQPKVSREKAQKLMKEFVGDEKPYMMAYVNQFDTICIYKLFGINSHPFHWLPVDFSSVLFSLGIDPESYFKNEFKFVRSLGIDPTQYRQHHALDDAKLLRDVYLKLASKN